MTPLPIHFEDSSPRQFLKEIGMKYFLNSARKLNFKLGSPPHWKNAPVQDLQG